MAANLGELRAQVGLELAGLKDLNIDELRRAWRARYGAPPYLRSGDVLRRCLAEKIQVEAFGGDPEVEARLLAMVRNYERSGRVGPPRHKLKPGTVLLREFGGKTHRIEVVETGFAWQGRMWSSLSKIALEITGTRWNGPAFFGLRDGPAK